MSYSYVKKASSREYRDYCTTLLRLAQKALRKKHITMDIMLTGSGKGNYVTANESGLFDLDYNLLIHRLPTEYEKYPERLKDLIRSTIDDCRNRVHSTFTVSFGKNSTVPISYECHLANKLIFEFDVAILRENSKTGKISRLVYQKSENRFLWNEIPVAVNPWESVNLIRRNGLNHILKKRYLEKKNSNYDGKASFILFIEAVNEVLQLI